LNEPCSELYTSTVILDHPINYRTFSSSSQNILIQHSFEYFLFQVNFTCITKTNICFGVSKITKCHLSFYHSTVIPFLCRNYSNCCTEITDIDEQVLVATIYFSYNFNSITNTNLCFEATTIIEPKHLNKLSFVIRS